MKQLINYCPVPGYDNDIPTTDEALKSYLDLTGLDGVELFIYQKQPYAVSYLNNTVGVHLKYWPFWLDFWREEKDFLKKKFVTKENMGEFYFGAENREEWLDAIREHIKVALKEEPEYLVWHVSESDDEEIFTFDFKYSDKEVIEGAAEVYNAVKEIIPRNVKVLFENLWWPGLKLTDKKVVETFFQLIKDDNAGIMLDTGHLMNTNPALKSEEEAAKYLCEVVNDLGNLKDRIKGLHLSCSLSGEYLSSFCRNKPVQADYMEVMNHIINIDRHQAWSTNTIGDLLKMVNPEYVVHELYYNDFSELTELVKKQQALFSQNK